MAGPSAQGIVTLLLVWPLNRDNSLLKPTSVAVTVIDNSSAIGQSDFQCRVTATAKNGTSIALGTLKTTVGTNSDGTTLSLPVPTAQVDGPMMVSYATPRRGVGNPASSMGSIKVVEPDPGN